MTRQGTYEFHDGDQYAVMRIPNYPVHVAVTIDRPDEYSDDMYGNEMSVFDQMPQCVKEVLRENPNRVNMSELLADSSVRMFYEKGTPEDFAAWLDKQLKWSAREIRQNSRRQR